MPHAVNAHRPPTAGYTHIVDATCVHQQDLLKVDLMHKTEV